jgi:hypothetical protein
MRFVILASIATFSFTATTGFALAAGSSITLTYPRLLMEWCASPLVLLRVMASACSQIKWCDVSGWTMMFLFRAAIQESRVFDVCVARLHFRIAINFCLMRIAAAPNVIFSFFIVRLQVVAKLGRSFVHHVLRSPLKQMRTSWTSCVVIALYILTLPMHVKGYPEVCIPTIGE